jgi:hypothetical protein
VLYVTDTRVMHMRITSFELRVSRRKTASCLRRSELYARALVAFDFVPSELANCKAELRDLQFRQLIRDH